MTDLYWITVFGNLRGVLGVFVWVLPFVSIPFIIAFFCEKSDYESYKRDSDKYWAKLHGRIIKGTLAAFIATLIGYIFIPTSSQLYAIYGVGTVIDYAKRSTELKKLPDNAIKALNYYLEGVNGTRTDSTNVEEQ